MCNGTAAARCAWLGGILLGLAVEGGAQDTRAYERRVDSLGRASRRLQAIQAAESDSLRRFGRRPRYDTLDVGPLRILTDTAMALLARSTAESVVTSIEPLYGRALKALSGTPFVVRVEMERGRPLAAITRLDRDGREATPVVTEREPAIMAVALRHEVLNALARDADAALKHWLGDQLPHDTAPSSAWSRARVELLSSHAAVSRRCYAGSVRDCRIALGLQAADDPVTQFLDSDDRRRLADELPGYEARRRRFPRQMEACLAGSDIACIEVLRSSPNIPAPLHSWHRLSVLQLAADIGGAGSMERVLTTSGTPAERIAAGAGIPTDSVIRLWVDRARHVSPPSEDISLGIAASSVVWILAFAGMALRSSRWR